LTIHRLVVRATNRSEAEAAAASFAERLETPLGDHTAWTASPRARLTLRNEGNGTATGRNAALALQSTLGGRRG
jgi:hypothetical protein